MFETRRVRCGSVLRTLILMLLVGTAACERSTGPATTTELDPDAALADYQAFEQMFSSDGWDGLQALGGRSSMSASSAVTALRTLPALADGRSGRRFALALFHTLTSTQGADAPFAKTIISTRHLGRTLVYDPAADQYVIDPSRTGAPANGVRFIVYEVDAAKRPIEGREIGHADLIDEGANSGEAIALRLVLVTRGTTTLDYRTRVELGTGTGKIDVSGFALDGASRLDFTIGVVGRTTGGKTLVDADFDLAMASRNFRITGTVKGVDDAQDGDGTVTLNVQHQEHSLRVTLKQTDDTVDGAILLNGATFVTISGSAANPTLRGASGQPVTGAELLVVRSVIEIADDVFDLIEDLVDPVDDLILLGAIL